MLSISCAGNLCRGDRESPKCRTQNVVDGQYRGKVACVLNAIPKFPIGVGSLASVSVRIANPKAPKVSLEAIGCQPPLWGRLRCRYLHRIVVVRCAALDARHCFAASSAPVVALLCFRLCSEDCSHLVVVS
jgi:hypothetical protein